MRKLNSGSWIVNNFMKFGVQNSEAREAVYTKKKTVKRMHNLRK